MFAIISYGVSANESLSTFVLLFMIMTDDSRLHPINANLPILFTDDGIKTLSKSTQSRKALASIYFTPDGIIRFSGVFRYAYPPIHITSGKMLVVEHANITLFEDFSIIELDPADLYLGLSFSTIMLLQYLLPRKEVESIRITDAGI